MGQKVQGQKKNGEGKGGRLAMEKGGGMRGFSAMRGASVFFFFFVFFENLVVLV